MSPVESSSSPSKPLNLAQAVQGIKKWLPIEASRRTPSQAASVFMASLHLMGELQSDQSMLHRRVHDKVSPSEAIPGNGELCRCPEPSDIPAISSVLHDGDLFRALIQCLQASTGPNEVATTLVDSENGVTGRKRSMSISHEGSQKSSKTSIHTLSPGPSSHRHINNHTSTTNPPSSRTGLKRTLTSSASVPTFHAPTVAATILYTALQHLDHWPVPLIQAYAEDCFGPRRWVDRPQCSLLVQNLALAHQQNEATADNMDVDMRKADIATLASNAAAVADTYHQWWQKVNSSRSPTASVSTQTAKLKDTRAAFLQQHRQAGSFSSLTKRTSSSSSGDSPSKAKKNSLKRPRWSTAQQKGTGGSDRSLSPPRPTNGNSSSSGEEDNVDGSHKRNTSASATVGGELKPFTASSQSTPKKLYPIQPENLDLTRVRQRYFATNLELAHASITATLSDRMDTKSKQNSGLLTCLPFFTSLPEARCLIAANLSKWLQSPALAGLARALFASTVANMKKIDPPLPQDLAAIDSIIEMRLKANQLNAHIENVTGIAKRLPVASVANRMYSRLLRDVLLLQQQHPHTDARLGGGTSTGDLLKMVAAIHKAILPQYSYEAMAAALLTLLVNHGTPDGANAMASAPPSSGQARKDRIHLVKQLRRIIRALASRLGSSFDGCMLVEGLLSLDVSTDTWSVDDEEDKARLMFQCISLSVSSCVKENLSAGTTEITTKEEESLRRSLQTSRTLCLTWFCTEYGPHHGGAAKAKSIDRLSGPGIPDYSSPLCQEIDEDTGGTIDKNNPNWLATMRCLLFLEGSNSSCLKNFFLPGECTLEDEADWENEIPRLQLCYQYGGNLTDELVWIVLKAASSSNRIDSNMAILVLEHLFENCGRNPKSGFVVEDPNIVWELYTLVLYMPVQPMTKNENTPSDSGDSFRNLPRLAYPALWWRVTMLALAMCGAAPVKVGMVMWDEHPTLQALIKMVTSGRFRFPTVDCDENAKIKAKQEEQSARERENSVAEYLFLPPKQEKLKKEAKGSRVSRRILKQQQERNAAKEVHEDNQRKKLLKVAHKSVMLWDPDGPARKPPRECVDLFLAVERMFALSDAFRRTKEPDFLLMTIGQTTREAIERAYTWLIPIVSSLPQAISRLPSSASCVLLLRAYGTEGDERKQLKQLSAPLLHHVKDSLNGAHGESDAVKAFDLLMTDVASTKSDRRRFARRVLHDALNQSERVIDSGSWMLDILNLIHSKSLVADAIKHLSTAASFERGRVLRSILLALEKHIAFAREHEIVSDFTFSTFLSRLLSTRPGVCANTMDNFSELRSLVVRVLHADFTDFATSRDRNDGDVEVVLRDKDETVSTRFPLSLLESISVLLSIWKDEYRDADKESASLVKFLANALLHEEQSDFKEEAVGLSTAKSLSTSTAAIPVESWIMLAKSQSGSLARRAAMSVPDGYLTRLLLCSGLPRASLLTMVDRLGRLGDSAESKEDVFENLMLPSASSEWDIGRVGIRRDVSRRLLGRLSSYVRLFRTEGKEQNISTTFISWLRESCLATTPKLQKTKKVKVQEDSKLSSLSAASSILSSSFLEMTDYFPTEHSESEDITTVNGEDLKTSALPVSSASPDVVTNWNSVQAFIANCLKQDRLHMVDYWIEENIGKPASGKLLSHNMNKDDCTRLALELYKVCQTQNTRQSAETLLLKWFPRLSSLMGDPALWELVFQTPVQTESRSFGESQVLLCRCLTTWSTKHVIACTSWIMTLSEPFKDSLDLRSISLFLLRCCGQPGSQVSLCTDSHYNLEWANSKESVTKITAIALRGLEQALLDERIEVSLAPKDIIPECVTLIFVLARRGKKQLRSICSLLLLKQTATSGVHRRTLESVFLRLYLLHPHWMDLGSPEARSALIQASTQHSNHWLEWNSSFDNKIEDMLQTLSSGDSRIAKSLADLSRKQPLLLLRKLHRLSAILEEDATIESSDAIELRGTIEGQNLGGKLETKFHDVPILLTVKYWGYRFVEPLWVALLDILSTMPKEVLYNCGLQVGLSQFLGVYLNLMSVQLQLLSANKVSRLKAKLNDTFKEFRHNNPSGWVRWLGYKIGDSEVRHLLMSCDFITPKEAIDSLKQNQQLQ